MAKILTVIQTAENSGRTKFMRFSYHYPLLSSLSVFIGVPLFVLSAVYMGSAAIVLPLAYMLGWL